MTSKKTIAVVAIIALVAAVIGGFVVFASVAATLDIQGNAEFQPESWNVRFRAASLQTETGLTGRLLDPQPALSDTVVGDFRAVLTQPGDSVTLRFWIENTGSLDAVLSTFTAPVPNCVGTSDTATADAALVCGNLVYTMRYIGGDLAENNLTLNAAVTQGNLLREDTSVQVELRLEYPAGLGAESLPTNSVTIGNLGRTLIYTVQH